MSPRRDGSHPVATPEPQWIDLILGEVTPAEQARLRQQVADDPLQALDMAEAVQLVERLRGAETAPGPLFACRMDRVLRESRRRLVRLQQPALWRQTAVVLAVAAAVLAALLLLRPSARGPLGTEARPDMPVANAVPGPKLPLGVPAPREEPLERLSRLLVDRPEEPLLRASERLSEQLQRDSLRSWLDPRNLLAVQRLDYELRASAERRRAALNRRGWLPEIDDRVQAIVGELVADLPFRLLDSSTEPIEVAFLVRALLASGTAAPSGLHHDDLQAAASWLQRRLPQLHDGDLAVALLALAESAASTLDGADLVHSGVERLIDEAFVPEAWSRRRPELLSSRSGTIALAECGRLLAMAPGFGVDPDRAMALRSLVVSTLEERLLQSPGDPALLAAMAYGFSDLLTDPEAVEAKLRAWRPAELVGNYVTLMQLAWSREPGIRGWARFQMEMRRVATQPTPAGFLDRCAMLLCLATNYAAPGVSGLCSVTD